MNNLGHLFVIAAASGTGKTSLSRELIKHLEHIEISVSHTTRPPRPGEEDGTDYYFIPKDTFRTMMARQEFLEYAQVFDHYYGTSAFWVREKLQQGIDIILEIDWQGAAKIRQLKQEMSSIFILPPSLKILHERLLKRSQDDQRVIVQRMAKAKTEISHYGDFDYLLINDDFGKALNQLIHIILDKRLQQKRQKIKSRALLAELLESS